MDYLLLPLNNTEIALILLLTNVDHFKVISGRQSLYFIKFKLKIFLINKSIFWKIC